MARKMEKQYGKKLLKTSVVGQQKKNNW